MQTFAPRDYRQAVGAFVLAWFLLSAPWLTGVVTIPYDAKALFQAQLQFLANALHSGQSPFWNPSTFVGMPQIADPQSLIFSPAILLAYFEKTPSFRELDAYVLLLLGFGGLATLKYCQDRDWHPAGASVAAVVFAFGGAAAWRIQHIVHIQSLAFFIVTLWLLARALQRSSVLYGALAGLAAALMLVEPNQVALLSCYVLVGYCVEHWLRSPMPVLAISTSLRPLGSCALVAGLAAGLPLMLTYLFLEASNRDEIPFADAARGSLHPASLLTAMIADLFGALAPAVRYWGPDGEGWEIPDLIQWQNTGQIYLGTLPMLLILTVGVLRGALWSRQIRIFSIAAGVLLLYALGGFTPLFGIFFSYAPGVSFFRRPVDAAFLTGALLSVVTGYLVHLWASAALPFASYGRQALEAGLIVALLAAGLATAWSVGKIDLAWKPITIAVVWITITSLLLAVPTAWRKRRRAFAIAAPTLILAADLALNNGPNESTALPYSQYEVLNPNCRNETIRFLKERLRRAAGSQWRDRVELVGMGFEWQNAAQVHGFDGTLGYNPLRLRELFEATGARDYIAGPDQKRFSPLFPSYVSMMADLLGLRFIVVSIPIEKVDLELKPGQLQLIARTSDAYIYENPRALPRVLLVKDWKQVDFDALLQSGHWPQFDPRQTVLLDAPPAAGGSAVHEASGGGTTSAARVLHYENTEVVIDVDAAQPGFVVLHDVWHPWWVAYVDGREVPLLRANVLFRAVQVPPGEHVVTFEFRPIAGAISEAGERLLQLVPVTR